MSIIRKIFAIMIISMYVDNQKNINIAINISNRGVSIEIKYQST